MTSRARLWLALPAIALASCESATPPSGFGVNLTVTANALASRDRAKIVQATVTVSGAESFSTMINASALRSGDLRVRYVPGVSSGKLGFRVDAVAADASVIASGTSGDVTVVAAQAVSAEINLGASPLDLGYSDGPSPDMATDLATIDLSTSDLAMADLAMPDLAMPDLAMADLTTVADLSPPPCQATMVSTLAGNGTTGFVDGTGGATGTTEFNQPFGVAVDGTGNVYVADLNNNRIRKVASDGSTTTLAGNGTVGFVDGTGGATGTTEFHNPSGVAVDSAGNVYVADTNNSRIRKVTSSGSTTTLAGNGTVGFVDGTGGAIGTAEFAYPWGLAIDVTNNVYVADLSNQRIRQIAPSANTNTLAGNGTAGFADGTGGATGSTEFNGPIGVTVDATGNVYVGDNGNNRIRRVAPGGNTSTLAGNGTAGFFDGTGGSFGTTQFKYPQDIAVDGAGNVYVADVGNKRIRKVATDGSTTTLAGDGTAGFADGAGCTAHFKAPAGVAVSGRQLFVADTADNRIRLIQLP